jgi:PncC family amidohydrolase
MTTSRQLDAAARRLAKVLKQRQLRIVLAESCTGGLISAVLAKIPGISDLHCGSAVVYRLGTKQEWLGISAAVLKKPGPVSRLVAAEMAERILERTPEADIAASITGHLGPGAPKRQDGLIYVGIAQRANAKQTIAAKVKRYLLPTHLAGLSSLIDGERRRIVRQRAAAEFVLQQIFNHLDQ